MRAQFDAAAVVEKYYNSWSQKKDNKYNPLIKYLTGVIGLNDELAKAEIARNWSAAGARASGDGTNTHLQIELCLNGVKHDPSSVEFRQYEAWRATRPSWRQYRTEWSVFSEEELVCGQIDSVFVDANDGTLHMADWKRVAEMKREGFQGERGFDPLQALPNSNYYHYVLQQNAYTWILERKYGLKIASMCLVQVHPDLSSFKEHPLPRIDREMDVIMERRRARVAGGELRVLDPAAVAASHKRKAPPDEAPRRAALAAHLRKLLAEVEGGAGQKNI